MPGQHKCQGSPQWNRSLKKSGPQSIGRSRGGLTTKIHMVTASDRAAVSFSLSPGNAGDALEGRKLLNFTPTSKAQRYLIMDRACEGDEARALLIWDGFPWFHQSKIGKNLGNTTVKPIRKETKSSDSS